MIHHNTIMSKKSHLLNIKTNLHLQHISNLPIAMNNQLKLITHIHHSNVINTVTTNNVLIILLDSNFPMMLLSAATVSVHTIASSVIRLATAGRVAYIVQLPTLLLQSIYRKTISWRCNYLYHLQLICNITGPLSLTTTRAIDS